MARITVGQAIQYARNAGFSGDALVNIVAIAWAESGLDTTVVNSIGATGILQILLSAHPDVTSAQAKDPQFSFNYAYQLSNGGRNFCAWQSWSGAGCGGRGYDNRYAQYVSQVRVQVGDASAASQAQQKAKHVASGDGNNFPLGQCTWWADERYHQLTGYFVPWNHTGQANAYQWLGQAKAFGWNTASSPPKGMPSIICLQGNAGQGVESSLGHVGIVERINGDGSIQTSNMNWSVGPISQYAGGYPVRAVTFRTGPGVSFIWAAGGSINTGGGSGGTYTPLLEQVHNTLVEVPGFYGMALALDEVEQYPGWIDLTDPSNSMDVVGWIRSLGATITDNFVPFAIRSMLVSLGIFILIMLVVKVVLEVGDKAAPIVKALI